MNRLDWIALAWHAQLGAATFHRLVERFGSPRAVAQARAEDLLSCRVRLKVKDLDLIGSSMEAAPAIADEVAALEEEGIRVLCPFDEGYPHRFLDLPAPPPVVCLAGTWEPEVDVPAVAVVGTRSPTLESARMARHLAQAFAEVGVTVVSGLALGIDAAAHEGALLGGGLTVAVLGSGIRVIHPPSNRELAAAIVRQGALISELPPRMRPRVRNLIARNRLQSALSDAVIVVQSGPQGGSLHTADNAKRQGRPVYAIDWQAQALHVQGTRRLLSSGAVPIRGPEDVPHIIVQIRARTMSRPEPKPEPPTKPRQLTLF